MRYSLLILFFALAFSCTTMAPIGLTPQEVQMKSAEKEIDLIGKTLDLTLQDGTRKTIEVVGVTADSIVSSTAEYKYDQILTIESKEFDFVKTTGATVGTIGAIALGWTIIFYTL